MLLLFLLPSYMIRFPLLGIPFTFLEGMILVLFSTWLFANYKSVVKNIKAKFYNRGEGIREYPFNFEIVFWIVLSFVAVWVSNFSNSAFGVWRAYFFEPILFYILVYNIFAKSTKSKKEFVVLLIWPLALSALLLSLYAIFQKFTGFGIINPFWADLETRRVTSIFLYPNALGLYLAPIIVLSTGLLTSLKKENNNIYQKLFLLFSIFLSLLAIIYAKSEGALVAVLISLILFVIIKMFSGKRKKIILVSGVAFILSFVFLSSLFYEFIVPKYSYPDFGSSIVNKIYDKITLKDFSGEVRKQQWRETFEMMKQRNRWFWGTGLSYYKESVEPYHQEGIFFNRDRDSDFRRKIVMFDEEYKSKYWYPVEIYMYPHNLLLNFWTELGLFGMLLFSWIIIKFFTIGIKLINKENKYLVLGIVLAMLTIIIHGIVDVPYFKNDLAVMFWVMITMMGILSLKNKNEEIQK